MYIYIGVDEFALYLRSCVCVCVCVGDRKNSTAKNRDGWI